MTPPEEVERDAIAAGRKWALNDLEAERAAHARTREFALAMYEVIDRPGCSGKWVGGSGGHRKHEPCQALADWWHPGDLYAYCADHRPSNATEYVLWSTLPAPGAKP